MRLKPEKNTREMGKVQYRRFYNAKWPLDPLFICLKIVPNELFQQAFPDFLMHQPGQVT